MTTTTIPIIEEGSVDTAAPAGSNVLDCAGKRWAPGLFGHKNHVVVAGDQFRYIVGNVGSALVIEGTWDVGIPKGVTFRIYRSFDLEAYLGPHEHESATDGGVDVEVDSTLVLAANPNRKYACFVNISDEWVFLGKGHDAVVDQGIPLGPLVGTYEIDWTNLYKGAIYGIHSGAAGTARVTIDEGE